MPSPRIDDALQDALLTANDALLRRRAAAIPEQTLARLVSMRWLQWRAGSLALTAEGESVLARLQAALLAEPEAA